MKQTINIFIIFLSIFLLFIPIKTYAIDTSNIQVVNGADGSLKVTFVKGVSDPNETKNYQDDFMEDKYNKYITVIAFVTAIATITMLGIFIKHVIHFAALGTEHWIVRRNAMFGLLWSGIATALLGSATLILALVYNAFQL